MLYYHLGCCGLLSIVVSALLFLGVPFWANAAFERNSRKDNLALGITLAMIIILFVGGLTAFVVYFPTDYNQKAVTRMAHGWSFGGHYVDDRHVIGGYPWWPKSNFRFVRAGLAGSAVVAKPQRCSITSYIKVVDKIDGIIALKIGESYPTGQIRKIYICTDSLGYNLQLPQYFWEYKTDLSTATGHLVVFLAT